MYVPPMYRSHDRAEVFDLMAGSPLATLITVRGGTPEASHVPVILDPAGPGGEPLYLYGHMNRVNPQWESVGSGCPAMLIFAGPHGYVSPTVYGYLPAAPTWNFTAVHASGMLSAIDQTAETMAVITATVKALEGRFGAGWDMHESMDYFDQLLPGVGAFRMEVQRLESMHKLSQEQEPGVRERVADSFSREDGAAQRQLAELMRRCLHRPRS
ncbi:FMN-binding negative transcriptional regulator [Micromonospora arborensis]|uniref:FMN-binding negative transcriptional regulator n=1 Tax=Micromonospora arborensis TaxID=2116518 RepID=UPI0033F50AD5